MADKNTVVIGSPEELGGVAARRSFLRALGVGGSIVLLPSLFAACGDDNLGPFGPPTAASGGGAVRLDLSTDIGILNYAFALEQLEAAFYSAVVGLSNFSTLITDANEREVLQDVRDDEVAHREFLRLAIPASGGTLIPNLTANFTAALASRTTILQTARSFEDLGVAAYNGAGKYLRDTGLLTLAGKIVSVEARHAAAIRDVLDTAGTAFGNVSDIEGTSGATGLGANNAQGLDGALEPSVVLQRVAATGVVTTPISIATQPSPVA